MLKSAQLVKSPEFEAIGALRRTLSEVPAIRHLDIEMEPPTSNVDFVARFEVGDQPCAIVGEVKSSGQPRHVRSAIHQLRFALDRSAPTFICRSICGRRKR